MDNDYPTFGSHWKHHSGRIYTVLGVANTGNINSEYPIVIVYVGHNENLWTKLIDDFYKTMKEIE